MLPLRKIPTQDGSKVWVIDVALGETAQEGSEPNRLIALAINRPPGFSTRCASRSADSRSSLSVR